MSVKIQTSKENRFGKTLHISGVQITFDKEGFAEVAEKDVSSVLNSTIELVDKTIKFASKEEQKLVAKQSDLLDKAKSEAEKIIKKAEVEAEKIIADAKLLAREINHENQGDEKTELRSSLEAATIKEIKDKLISSHIPEDSFKNIVKKDDLIDFALKAAFPE